MSSEAFKPQADMKGQLTATFGMNADLANDAENAATWATDQGLSHNEIIEEHALNYGRDRGASKIGQVGRATENKDVSEYGEDGKEAKAKAESKKAMAHILHMQYAEKMMADLFKIGEKIKEIGKKLDRFEDLKEELDELKKIKNTPSLDDDRAYLKKKEAEGDPELILYMQEHGINSVDDMTDEQINEFTDNKINSLEAEIAELKQDIINDLEAADKEIEQFKKDNPNWHENPQAREIMEGLEKKLDQHKARAKELGIDYDDLEKEIKHDKRDTDVAKNISVEKQGYSYFDYKRGNLDSARSQQTDLSSFAKTIDKDELSSSSLKFEFKEAAEHNVSQEKQGINNDAKVETTTSNKMSIGGFSFEAAS